MVNYHTHTNCKEYDDFVEETLYDPSDSYQANGEYIIAYTIDTTPEEEAINLGDGDGFSCANNTSTVLKKSGFKRTHLPDGLENQLKNSPKVEQVTVYKDDDNEK